MIKNGKTDLRDLVLVAARKLLVHEGVQGVTMRKIATEIGCKAPSIYYHFENKDELLQALVDEGQDLLYTHLQETQENLSAAADPIKKLETHLRALVTFSLDNPEYFKVMYLEPSEDFVRFPDERHQKSRRVLEMGAELYSEAMAVDLVAEADSEEAMEAATVMLNGYIAMALLHRIDTRFDQSKLLEDIIARVFRGMGVDQVPA